MSFLLGLNWTKQRELQSHFITRGHIRQAVKALKEADSEAKVRSIGELEADRVALETAIRQKKQEVESFNVREDYNQLEVQLASVDRELHKLLNENHTDERLKEFYEENSTQLPTADASRPMTILQEAGAVFSAEGLRRLEEVASFHSNVYRNRKEFLAEEIRRLEGAISHRRGQIGKLADEKSRLLSILKSSGAIDSLIELQRAYTDLVAKHGALVALIDERRRFDRRDDDLSEKIAHERALLRRDLEERQKAIDEVRELFAEYMRVLYGVPGRLSVDVGTEGYTFSFTFERQGSDGVEQMVVFCFDLTVAAFWAKRKQGFPVLAHDSTLFADVDPRQYGAALKLAAEESAKHGFQYICCLNTGSLPRESLLEYNIQSHVRARLTDKGAEGRLLGLILPPREKAPKKKR